MDHVDHPSTPFARMSARDLRGFAVEAIRRHPELRELIPDPDARFSQALVQAFIPGETPQATDLREALARALGSKDGLQRLWALTDLVAALAAGFDTHSDHADEAAEVGAEIASLVHENAHVVADEDIDLLDSRWVDVVYAAWARGWAWAEELSDALAHGVEGDAELTDHLVRLAEADAARAPDAETASPAAALALRARIAAGQMEEARQLVRRYGLGVEYCAILASVGRVPEILVQHGMLLDERREYATVAMGLALAGYPAEGRALAEAGRAWGTGDESHIDEVLAQIPDPPPPTAAEPPPWAQGDPATWFSVEESEDADQSTSQIERAYAALQEGRMPEAVSLLLEEQLGLLDPSFCAWVAARAEAAGVHRGDVAALLESAAEGEIYRANRKSYAKAVHHLEGVRRLLDELGRWPDWVRLLDDLRHEHARKGALLEVLEPLLKEAGLAGRS
jgi:hypothetical protein